MDRVRRSVDLLKLVFCRSSLGGAARINRSGVGSPHLVSRRRTVKPQGAA
jgi:hypothetical protein